jgi:hypothetical protein
MCNAHLFPSGLALFATIRVYLDAGTLDAQDLETVVDTLLTPEHRARHKFASDLLVDLAEQVVAVPVARRKTERAARVREEMQRWESERHIPAGSIFKPVD